MGKYQSYPEYKDSDVEWIGDVPEHWTTSKFTNYIDIRHGYQFRDYDFTDEGIKIIKITQLDRSGHIVLSKCSKISSSRLLEFPNIQIKEKDILMCLTGGTIGKIVRVGRVKEPLLQNYRVGHFSSGSPLIIDDYIYYLMSSSSILEQINFLLRETGQPNIGMEDFGEMKICIPELEVQQKIANFLDHETAQIDTLIEKQQQLIKLLKEKRQAVISNAVTKGLNPDAPMRESGVEWLGDVPEHWEVCKLKHIIASLESGVSVNAADLAAQRGEFGVLKTSCVYTRMFRIEENKTVVKEEYDRVKCPIRKGAIIISRMNTPELVGASALVDVEDPNIFLPDRLWQTVFMDEKTQNPKFIAYFMMIKGFRSQISLAAEGASSSMQNIAKGDYLSINVTFPDLGEQDEIVGYLEKRLSDLKELENRANMAIELMQERRTALISAAVTGKIDVRNWVVPETSNNKDEEVAA